MNIWRWEVEWLNWWKFVKQTITMEFLSWMFLNQRHFGTSKNIQHFFFYFFPFNYLNQCINSMETYVQAILTNFQFNFLTKSTKYTINNAMVDIFIILLICFGLHKTMWISAIGERANHSLCSILGFFFFFFSDQERYNLKETVRHFNYVDMLVFVTVWLFHYYTTNLKASCFWQLYSRFSVHCL